MFKTIVIWLRKCHAWFRVGYVMTRPIDRKLPGNESSPFSIKAIISRLEKGEKGKKLSLEFKINKQQMS